MNNFTDPFSSPCSTTSSTPPNTDLSTRSSNDTRSSENSASPIEARASTFTHPRGKPISKEEKIIIINIYRYFSSENPSLFVKELVEKVAHVTGYGCRSVQKIIQEFKAGREIKGNTLNRKKSTRTIFSKLDDSTKFAIQKKVRNLCSNQESPTINQILAAVNNDEELPNFKRSSFYAIFKKLEFK